MYGFSLVALYHRFIRNTILALSSCPQCMRWPGKYRVRRVVLSLSNAAVDLARRVKSATKFYTKEFQQCFRSARAGRERFPALIFAKIPAVLDLAK